MFSRNQSMEGDGKLETSEVKERDLSLEFDLLEFFP